MSALPVVAAVLVFALAAVLAVVGVLGLIGRLPFNRWIGVRADETMRSREAFDLANRVAAPGMLGAAGILLLSGLVTLGVGGYWAIVFAVVGLIAALFVVGLVSAYGVRAAAVLAADDDGCSCCSSHETSATDVAHESSPADDCGTSSCGACSLRGVCSNESAQA
ncbi:SdpI family protein [Gordonia sp. ABSL11-1]|uniref:SdpI family protein n=1 Tax=Gordonia sp. ABSL11-1 TaxID=3053924 RepID=UPI00257466DE|nr:SdpI family protein [Gordonia sp. ABSL11-1]MDL9947819.1 SdpI family protein [Gordonia sp. ABSL11-1]